MDKFLLNIINEILEDKELPKINELKSTISLRRDLCFDSMDLAFLTAKVDEECGVDIFEDGIIDTVEDIFKKLKQKEL